MSKGRRGERPAPQMCRSRQHRPSRGLRGRRPHGPKDGQPHGHATASEHNAPALESPGAVRSGQGDTGVSRASCPSEALQPRGAERSWPWRPCGPRDGTQAGPDHGQPLLFPAAGTDLYDGLCPCASPSCPGGSAVPAPRAIVRTTEDSKGETSLVVPVFPVPWGPPVIRGSLFFCVPLRVAQGQLLRAGPLPRPNRKCCPVGRPCLTFFSLGPGGRSDPRQPLQAAGKARALQTDQGGDTVMHLLDTASHRPVPSPGLGSSMRLASGRSRPHRGESECQSQVAIEHC